MIDLAEGEKSQCIVAKQQSPQEKSQCIVDEQQSPQEHIFEGKSNKARWKNHQLRSVNNVDTSIDLHACGLAVIIASAILIS